MIKMNSSSSGEIEKYIGSFPGGTQKILEKLLKTIREAAPDAEEGISYGIPAFKYHGILVYFAGYKNHIGFYPTASGIRAFEKELVGFKCSKGTVQFPINRPIPIDLVKKIVKFRVMKNLEKSKAKRKK